MDNTMYYDSLMVCSDPVGDGLQIGRMPEMFAEEDTDAYSPHLHTFYELIWFQEGGGRHYVDMGEYEIRKDSLLFLSPGQIHHFDKEKLTKGITLRFCPDFLAGEDEDSIFIRYYFSSFLEKNPLCMASKEALEFLGRMVEMLEKEKNEIDGFGHVTMLHGMVKMLFIGLYRYGLKAPGNVSGAKSKEQGARFRLFIRFRKMVEENFCRMHTVTEYALSMGVGAKTLAAALVECSGMRPLDYIEDRIMLEAKRLLRYSDLRLNEIAYRLGYDDSSYFSKVFKRNTGWRPSEFRNMKV